MYQGLLVATVPLQADKANGVLASTLFATSYALSHMVIEGIAFLLMQKGCGQNATIRAGKFTACWGVVTFFVTFAIFRKSQLVAVVLEVLWGLLLIVLYYTLWLAPQKHLFRRPAAIIYARFWSIFRTIAALINLTFLFLIRRIIWAPVAISSCRFSLWPSCSHSFATGLCCRTVAGGRGSTSRRAGGNMFL